MKRNIQPKLHKNAPIVVNCFRRSATWTCIWPANIQGPCTFVVWRDAARNSRMSTTLIYTRKLMKGSLSLYVTTAGRASWGRVPWTSMWLATWGRSPISAQTVANSSLFCPVWHDTKNPAGSVPGISHAPCVINSLKRSGIWRSMRWFMISRTNTSVKSAGRSCPIGVLYGSTCSANITLAEG